MTTWQVPLLTFSVLVPALAATVAVPTLSRAAARRLGVAITLAVFGLTTAASVEWHLSDGMPAADVFDPGSLLGATPVLAIDGVNAVLVPFAALIFAFVLFVQPSTLAIERALRRVFVAEAVTLTTFLSSDPFVLAGLWCLSAAGGWYELRNVDDGGHDAARVFARYVGPSCVALVLGVLAVRADAVGVRAAGSLVIALAVMVRKGIVPLHSWMPELFAHAPLPASVLFNAPQVGASTIRISASPS
jgi:NADH-quinone oxidoreductase subunit M